MLCGSSKENLWQAGAGSQAIQRHKLYCSLQFSLVPLYSAAEIYPEVPESYTEIYNNPCIQSLHSHTAIFLSFSHMPANHSANSKTAFHVYSISKSLNCIIQTSDQQVYTLHKFISFACANTPYWCMCPAGKEEGKDSAKLRWPQNLFSHPLPS